jgi:hypothetical protein
VVALAAVNRRADYSRTTPAYSRIIADHPAIIGKVVSVLLRVLARLIRRACGRAPASGGLSLR